MLVKREKSLTGPLSKNTAGLLDPIIDRIERLLIATVPASWLTS